MRLFFFSNKAKKDYLTLQNAIPKSVFNELKLRY